MTYKESFIKFMVDSGVLKFGEFTLKSGRLAPYFINAGNYKTGAQLAKLGEFYAECIMENGLKPQTLFGPAYKGIPLSVAACTALYNKFGVDVNYCFDRKEVKDHGEGGMFVGKTLEDHEKVVIIEDVMTSGKAVYDEFGVKVYSIVNINDIIDALENDVIPGKEYVEKMKEYRKVYGVG